MYTLKGRQMKCCYEIIVIILTLFIDIENKHMRT